MKRIISLVLTLAILLSCAPTIVVTKAAAVQETETQSAPTTLYTVTDLGVEGAVIVETIEEAFYLIEQKNKQWGAEDSVEIQIKGEAHSGGFQNGLLFGQTTLWREDGTKLPITIRGVDTNLPKDAYIYLDSAGGWYACANDYTFINLTLPVGDQETLFYAGSGNITLIDVLFNKRSGGISSIEAQTSFYEVGKFIADKVCQDENDLIKPDVTNIPAGDAWQLARERDRYIGEGLRGVNGNYYGDAKHDGDTGGGQYLNACIYFEVMTGLSCVGNTWRPDYELSEDMIEFLQNVAHDTVTAVYGEDHYVDSWTDVAGEDNEFNILILGSSVCYYLRDELYFLCAEAGIKTRVYHAYYSGVKMNTQWSWVKNGNGKYSLYKVENGKTTSVSNQKITDFLMTEKWDAIATYQCSSAMDDHPRDTEEGRALIYQDCQYADDFINYIYDYQDGAHQNAKYYWYQVVAGPVGATSMKSDTAGSFYADNCTQAAYAGWDELEPGEKVQSSITFGHGSVYRNVEDGKIAAVGYMIDAPETPYTDETARDAKYMEVSGYDSIADIRPADVEASIILDGDQSTFYRVHAKTGYAPSDGAVIMKQGAVEAAIYGVQAPTGSTAPYYGDIDLEYYGGNLGTWRGIYANVTGDVTVILDGGTISNYMTTVSAGYTVDGDILFDIRDGRIEGRIYTAGNGNTDEPAIYATVTGTVTFRWGGGYIKEIRHGRRAIIGDFVNEFYVNPDAEIPASTDSTFYLGGIDSCTIQGEVRNNFIGAVPASVIGKIASFGNSTTAVRKIVNTVKADEAGNAPTFTTYNGGAATEIVNNIEAGVFEGFTPGTGTTVTGTITGGTFAADPSAYVPEGHSAVKNADGTYTVENHNYVLVSSTPVTCVSAGEMRYECSDCGETKVVTLDQNPDAHDWDATDPERMVCKNGCGIIANAKHPFEYLNSIYCEGCKRSYAKSLWTPITMETLGCTAALETATTFGMQDAHYYLAEDINLNIEQTKALLESRGAVCLHLNGRTLRGVANQDDLDATGGNTGSNVNVGSTGTGNAIFAQSGTLNIMGEGYVAGRDNSSNYATVCIFSNASVNIYGGTYNNHRKDRTSVLIRNTGGTLTIYGGTFQDPVGIISEGSEAGTIIVEGGNFEGIYFAKAHSTGAVAAGSSITVNGGNINPGTAFINTSSGICAPSVTGGNFNFNPSDYLASGYVAKQDGDGWKVVEAPKMPVYGTFDPEGCDGQAYCEACYKQALAAGKTDAEAKAASLKQWTVYTGGYTSTDTLKETDTHEHLYLTENAVYTSVRFLYVSAGKVCLNLNGCDVTKNAENTEKYATVKVNGTGVINIMDSEGDAVVTGIDINIATRPNVLFVDGGVCNLYGGTFREVNRDTVANPLSRMVMISADGELNVYQGATIDGAGLTSSTREAIEVKGTMTLDGGELIARRMLTGSFGGAVRINGGTMYIVSGEIHDHDVYGNSSTVNGGMLAVTNSGSLIMTGGKIYGGKTENDGGNLYITGGGTFTMSGDAEIYGGQADSDGGNVYVSGGTFTMNGGKIYGGSAAVRCANIYLTDTTFTQSGDAEIYSYSIETAAGRTWYATAAEALANYQATDAAYIGLWDNVEFALTEDAYVALMVGATPTVSGAHKLYAMDASQDDYAGTAYSWIVAEETEIVRDVKNPVNGNRYLNVTTAKDEGEQTISSYRMDLHLSNVTLRAATEAKATQMGLYYKANISMGKTLAEKLDAYGVVLSLVDMPGADFETDLNNAGKNENGYTRIQETLDVSSANDYTVTVNSGAVFGIMKTDLDPAVNAARGQMDVYANAYLAIDADGDGNVEYYMADTDADTANDVAWSLYDVMKKIDADWAEFTAAHSKVTAFYSYWAQYGMSEWEAELPNIASV